jgi:cholesterol transport system auxiliary component
LALCCVAAALAGCAGGGAPGNAMTSYDFGLPAPAASAAPRLRGPVKVLEVRAPAALDTTEFNYRLQYANGSQLHAYAAHRWTMTPAQLLTQRLRASLAAHGAVLGGSDAVQAPVLRVELVDFEQVFDAPGASRGVVALRATLLEQGRLVAQQTFTASAAAPTADAPGGARALALASSAAIDQIAGWLARQPAG